MITDLAAQRIIGKGPDGYREALEFLKETRSERLASTRLRALARASRCSSRTRSNVRYLTGFESSNAALLVDRDRVPPLHRLPLRRGRARTSTASSSSRRSARL